MRSQGEARATPIVHPPSDQRTTWAARPDPARPLASIACRVPPPHRPPTLDPDRPHRRAVPTTDRRQPPPRPDRPTAPTARPHAPRGVPTPVIAYTFPYVCNFLDTFARNGGIEAVMDVNSVVFLPFS